MHLVEPIETKRSVSLPYIVNVDGLGLRDSRGRLRRFKDSFSAALAGARHVDKLRATASGEVKP